MRNCYRRVCLQCFDAVGWAASRKGIWPVKTEWWGTGVVICLKWEANDLHDSPVDVTATPSALAPVKYRMVYLSGAGLPKIQWHLFSSHSVHSVHIYPNLILIRICIMYIRKKLTALPRTSCWTPSGLRMWRSHPTTLVPGCGAQIVVPTYPGCPVKRM